MIEYDYSKLKGRIRELGISQEQFASLIGISEQTLYKKFNNRSYFNQKEIDLSMIALKEPREKSQQYFFTKKVAKNETN